MNVEDIINRYRSVFPFSQFNSVQRSTFNDIFIREQSVVVQAPTGSGKTVVIEFGVLKNFIKNGNKFKIFYICPLKSLCRERMLSWENKFKEFNIKGISLTTDQENVLDLDEYNVIYTTPEKIDFMTRRSSFKIDFQTVRLICLDEIHTLNDNSRGATLEVIVTRLKGLINPQAQFIAVSATINNIQDICTWLSTETVACIPHVMEEKHRTVKLEKIVLSCARSASQSLFQFDNIISHKIPDILSNYSAGKPVLIFCMTRKSTLQLAKFLIDHTKFQLDVDNVQQLAVISQKVADDKLRSVIICGVAFHHAGISSEDRQIVENSFLAGAIPVLCCTSTLAMGVNLPAHLVIVKGTRNYSPDGEETYTQNKLLQMIGRAGRPQFDTEAVAVILTQPDDEREIRQCLQCSTETIESQLLQNLTEHLNTEIATSTLCSMDKVREWLKKTFLYIRCKQYPIHYGFGPELSINTIENQLIGRVVDEIFQLIQQGLVKSNADFSNLSSTILGNYMSIYFLTLTTMRKIVSLSGSEDIQSLLHFLSDCEELAEINLRFNERTIINSLNRHRGPNKLRFPLTGRINTWQGKVMCLTQATLGSQKIFDSTLQIDSDKIFRIGIRILRCLHDFLMLDELEREECVTTIDNNANSISNDNFNYSPLQSSLNYKTLVSCTMLKKCFAARLWENCWLPSLQLQDVSVVLAEHLTSAGFNSLNKIANAKPEHLDTLLKKSYPFGKKLVQDASGYPRFEIMIEQLPEARANDCDISIVIYRYRQVTNCENNDVTFCHSKFNNDTMVLIIGDADNRVWLKNKIPGRQFSEGKPWSTNIHIIRSNSSSKISVELISENYVGFDIHTAFSPTYIIDALSNTTTPVDNSVIDVAPRKKKNSLKDVLESVKVQPAAVDRYNKSSSTNVKVQPAAVNRYNKPSNPNVDGSKLHNQSLSTPLNKKVKVFSWKSCDLYRSSQGSSSQLSQLYSICTPKNNCETVGTAVNKSIIDISVKTQTLKAAVIESPFSINDHNSMTSLSFGCADLNSREEYEKKYVYSNVANEKEIDKNINLHNSFEKYYNNNAKKYIRKDPNSTTYNMCVEKSRPPENNTNNRSIVQTSKITQSSSNLGESSLTSLSFGRADQNDYGQYRNIATDYSTCPKLNENYLKEQIDLDASFEECVEPGNILFDENYDDSNFNNNNINKTEKMATSMAAATTNEYFSNLGPPTSIAQNSLITQSPNKLKEEICKRNTEGSIASFYCGSRNQKYNNQYENTEFDIQKNFVDEDETDGSFEDEVNCDDIVFDDNNSVNNDQENHEQSGYKNNFLRRDDICLSQENLYQTPVYNTKFKFRTISSQSRSLCNLRQNENCNGDSLFKTPQINLTRRPLKVVNSVDNSEFGTVENRPIEQHTRDYTLHRNDSYLIDSSLNQNGECENYFYENLNQSVNKERNYDEGWEDLFAYIELRQFIQKWSSELY